MPKEGNRKNGAKEAARDTKSERPVTLPSLLGLKMDDKDCVWPPEAGSDRPLVTANKETGTSVLQPQGTYFCQQPE